MTETPLPVRPTRRGPSRVRDRVRDRTRLVGAGLVALIAAQALCAGFFLDDILDDLAALGPRMLPDRHLTLEVLANLGLIAAILVEARVLVVMRRRQARDAERLALASGALHELARGWFEDWGLTAAEADVAMFTLKGLSIAEIARLRGSAEGTVKAHLNAIYRKAGVSGRLQLQGLVVEELMAAPLVPPAPDRRGKAPDGADPEAGIVTGTGRA